MTPNGDQSEATTRPPISSHDENNSTNTIPKQMSWRRRLFPTLPQESQPVEEKINVHWGDALIKATHPKTLRVYFQNINGLTTGNISADWAEKSHQMNDHNVGIFGFAETNTHWKHAGTLDQVHQTSKQVLKHYRIQTTESDEPHLS